MTERSVGCALGESTHVYLEDMSDLGELLVERYINKQLERSVQKVMSEKIGCGCLNCVREAVSDANSWLELAGGYGSVKDFHFEVNPENNSVLTIQNPQEE